LRLIIKIVEGYPSWTDRIETDPESEGATEINQRITSRYHLLPLDRENSFAYIKHRLAVAGEPDEIFSQKALARVFELSGGIPRLMNVLCDRALLGTYEEKSILSLLISLSRPPRRFLAILQEQEKQTIRIKLWQKLVLVTGVIALGAGAAFYYSGNRASVMDLSEGKKLPAEVKSVKAVTKATKDETAAEKQQQAEQKENPAKVSIRIVPLEIND